MLVHTYCNNMHALLVLFLFAVCQRSIFVPPFGKRVQRYDLFQYWQNVSATFLKKNEKLFMGEHRRKSYTLLYNIKLLSTLTFFSCSLLHSRENP